MKKSYKFELFVQKNIWLKVRDRVQCFGYYDFGWVYQFKKLKLPKIRNRWTTLICYILVSRFNLTFDYDEKPDQRVWFKLVIGLSTGWSYLLNNRKLLKLYFKVITTLILFKGQGLVASVSKKWTSCQPGYLPITFWSSAKTRERIIRLNFEWRDVASEMWPVTQYHIKRSKVTYWSPLWSDTLCLFEMLKLRHKSQAPLSHSDSDDTRCQKITCHRQNLTRFGIN